MALDISWHAESIRSPSGGMIYLVQTIWNTQVDQLPGTNLWRPFVGARLGIEDFLTFPILCWIDDETFCVMNGTTTAHSGRAWRWVEVGGLWLSS